MNPKIFIGPVSKNVIDSTIELANFYEYPIGLIPSRRQVDYSTELSYVNGFDTKSFVKYVRSRSKFVVIERDHSGPHQGKLKDDGVQSILTDCTNKMNLIHIDPWKYVCGIYIDGFSQTSKLIKHAHFVNKNIEFEISTEESIQPLSRNILEDFIIHLKTSLTTEEFDKIKYLVIQSGTGLNMIKRKNSGKFDLDRLKKMVHLAKDYNLLSKEHNGDYLTKKQIKTRFENGLDAINVAPELGQIESQCVVKYMNKNQLDQFFNITYNDGSWAKWTIGEKYTPVFSKKQFVISFGHYVFSSKEFKTLKRQLPPTIDDIIKIKLKERIYEYIKSAESNSI